jgi:hypothetical protein
LTCSSTRDAETAYYQALVDYNRAIMQVHYRKGSLLDYDGVLLAEGPWPGKAYFDAMREARKRDAATYIDYGFTRPDVFSRGAYEQNCIDGCETGTPTGGPMIVPTPVEPMPQLGEPEALPMPDVQSLGPQAYRGGALSQAPYSTAHRPYRPAATHPNADERQANYASAAAAQAPAIGQWGGR